MSASRRPMVGAAAGGRHRRALRGTRGGMARTASGAVRADLEGLALGRRPPSMGFRRGGRWDRFPEASAASRHWSDGDGLPEVCPRSNVQSHTRHKWSVEMPHDSTTRSSLAVGRLVRGVLRLRERVLGQTPSRSLQAGQWFRLSFRAFTTQQSLLHATAQAKALRMGRLFGIFVLWASSPRKIQERAGSQ